MNQDLIEKNYYESLMVGHYIDVRYSEHEWKIAKITERDKRYAVVAFDGTNIKDEVFDTLFSKFYCKASKLRHLECGQRGTRGRLTKHFDPIQHPFNYIKLYGIFYTAFGNFAADLYERHTSTFIYHKSIPTRGTVRLSSYFAMP